MDAREPGIRPPVTLGRRLDVAARVAFPGALTALLQVLAAGPLHFGGQAELEMALALGSVFFWTVHRPLSLPPLLVFALGLLADLLAEGPFGLLLFTLLLVHALALHWRGTLARQELMLVWLAFAAIALGAGALQWAVTSLLALRLLPVAPAAFETALAVGLYPPLAVLLGQAHRRFAEPARA
jgi:rod shape-determining protein MreD